MLLNVLKRVLRSLTRTDRPDAVPVAPRETAAPDLHALLERAGAAHGAGELEQARRAYEMAFGMLPEAEAGARAAVLINLAAIFREQVRLPQAIAALREALVLQPAMAIAHYNLGLNLYEVGEQEEAETCLRSAIALEPDFQAAHSTLLCLYGLARSENPGRVLAEHRRWAEKFADPLTAKAPPHSNERSAGRRLTVGYVSADFREHSVARFISPILANHDRSRFRVICYDNWPNGDATTERLREHADAWRKIDELDDDQTAQMVRADGVDILIDLSGHTTGNRLLMFARKPAPVQASWLGYMCTTGMAAMDWHITDPHLDPPGTSDRWYTERLMRIASAAAFEPHPDSPPVNAPPVAANGFVRFASFNNYTKIGDEVIALWARVLVALPEARLLLVALGGDDSRFQESVVARFEKLSPLQGVSRRIEVIGRRPLKDFLRMFHGVDIALDPFPNNGGTTSLHTLWMGVPLVTLEGDSELARSTSGMLFACGLGDLVAHDAGEYVKVAVDLATNPGRIGELRKSLRQRLSSSALANAKLVTRSLEDAYRAMWSDYMLAGDGAVRMGAERMDTKNRE